ADYKGAGPALRILAFGALLFGLLYVTTTVITAGGRPLVTLALAGLSLVANAAFGFAWIPKHGLPGAATAVVISMMLGAMGSLIYLTLKYGWILPVATVIRLAGCAGIIYVMSLAITPGTKLMLVGKLAILAVVFPVLLVMSKEIKRSDLTAFRGIVRISIVI